VTALATGVSIAAYTVLDGIGVRRSGDALGYAVWLFVGLGPVAVGWAVLLRGRRLPAAVARNWRTGLAAGVISTLSYGAVVLAQAEAPLAAVAALRETGVVVSVLIGVVVFRERVTSGRVVAVIAVVTGVILLYLG
jgi:drug/metabolite transporter (DMT)-like permease